MHPSTRTLVLIVTLALGLAGPLSARADFCLQLDGTYCPLSGDLGFFHFSKRLPRRPGKIEPLHGRACGFGSATGTAESDRYGGMEIGVNFFCDAVPGQFELFFDDLGDPNGGFGYASYGGDYGVWDGFCDVTVVDCSLEP